VAFNGEQHTNSITENNQFFRNNNQFLKKKLTSLAMVLLFIDIISRSVCF